MLNMALPMFQNLVKKDVFQVLIYASFRINEVLQAHHINVDEDVPMVIREALKKFEVDVTHIVGTPFGFKVTKKGEETMERSHVSCVMSYIHEKRQSHVWTGVLTRKKLLWKGVMCHVSVACLDRSVNMQKTLREHFLCDRQTDK